MHLKPISFHQIPIILNGQTHLAPFQILVHNGEPMIRLGDTLIVFNRDGSFKTIDGRYRRATPEDIAAAREFTACLALLDNARKRAPEPFFPPGTDAHESEKRGWPQQPADPQAKAKLIIIPGGES